MADPQLSPAHRVSAHEVHLPEVMPYPAVGVTGSSTGIWKRIPVVFLGDQRAGSAGIQLAGPAPPSKAARPAAKAPRA